MMNNHELAKEIIRLSGGEANIVQAWHCVTRLRFNLKAEDKANSKEIAKLKGVLGVQFQNGQFQVVIGNNVAAVFAEVDSLLGNRSSLPEQQQSKRQERQNVINVILDTISGIFTPVLPAIIGAGMLKGFLALFVTLGWLSAESGEYSILNIVGNAAFYFLPFLLAVSSARKFKVNEFLAMSLAGAMLYPTILDAYHAGQLDPIHFLSLPVSIVAYSESVIPIILGVWLMSFIYRWVDRFIPNVLKIIFTPMLVLMITVPLVLIFIGPLGNYAGVYLEQGISWLFAHSGPLAGIVLGALMPLIVMTGMHYAFFPGTLQSLGKLGYDVLLLPISLVTNVGQAGAVFAVFFRTKNKELKSIALSSGISALLGITEPALYGVSLKLKKPFYASLIGGAVGGGFITAVGLKCFGFAVPGLISLPLYIDPAGGTTNLVYALIGIALSFVISFVVSLFLGFDDLESTQGTEMIPKTVAETVKEEQAKTPMKEISADQQARGIQYEVYSPLTGEIIPLSALPDKTFSEELAGKGIAIRPTEGKVAAPFDGIVAMVGKTKHAMMIRSHEGVEMLIHLGLETVSLKGRHFDVKVAENQIVKQGDILIEFDHAAIEGEGINLASPLIVTNTPDFLDVVPVNVKGVVKMNDLLLIAVK